MSETMFEIRQTPEIKSPSVYHHLDENTSQEIIKQWHRTLTDHLQTVDNPLSPDHSQAYLVEKDWGNIALIKDAEGKGVRVILITQGENGDSVAGYGSITQTETSEPRTADITFKIFQEAREQLKNKTVIIKDIVNSSVPLLDSTPNAVVVGQRQQSYKGGVEGKTPAAIVYRKAGFSSNEDNPMLLEKINNKESLSPDEIESLAKNPAYFRLDNQALEIEKVKRNIQSSSSQPENYGFKFQEAPQPEVRKDTLTKLRDRLKNI